MPIWELFDAPGHPLHVPSRPTFTRPHSLLPLPPLCTSPAEVPRAWLAVRGRGAGPAAPAAAAGVAATLAGLASRALVRPALPLLLLCRSAVTISRRRAWRSMGRTCASARSAADFRCGRGAHRTSTRHFGCHLAAIRAWGRDSGTRSTAPCWFRASPRSCVSVASALQHPALAAHSAAAPAAAHAPPRSWCDLSPIRSR